MNFSFPSILKGLFYGIWRESSTFRGHTQKFHGQKSLVSLMNILVPGRAQNR